MFLKLVNPTDSFLFQMEQDALLDQVRFSFQYMPKKDFGKLRPASNLKKLVVKLVSVIEVSV